MAKILLVDDDPMIIKLYQLILKNQAFDLTIAITGQEMLLAVSTQKPDVILLDVVLPDSSGLDLCTKIKTDPEFEGTKVILVSGEEISPVQIAKGIELGADDYLVKPVHPKELLARVNNCIKLKTIEEELRDKNKELKELSQHLQNVREEERKILAYEVQEELGQLTAALKMDVDWLSVNIPQATELQISRMANASATSKLMISNVRKIASALRPSMLDELDLYASLEWQCRKVTVVNNIPCVFEHDHQEENLSPAIKTAAFRICEDALANIIQHANATRIFVNMKMDINILCLTIMDNGQGFDLNQQKPKLGLVEMRERTSALKGNLDIYSEISKGTTITVTIPIL